MWFQPRQHHFSAFERHAELTVSERVHWEERVALQIWTRRNITSGTMLEKYHKLQPKPKTTDELKVALQTIWEELPQEHVIEAVANFAKRWLPIGSQESWLLKVVTPSSNSVHLQVCILISSPTNRLFSEPPTDHRWRQLRMLRNGVLSWLK